MVKLVIVGVNDKNEDMITTVEGDTMMRSTTEDGGEIIEEGMRCPEQCPPPSPLNS